MFARKKMDGPQRVQVRRATAYRTISVPAPRQKDDMKSVFEQTMVDFPNTMARLAE